MGTSSARLSNLDGFVTAAVPIAEGLDAVRTTGRSRIDDFVAGAGEVPVSIDATTALAYVDDYRAEVEHLGAWVGQVAQGFRDIGATVPSTGLVTADDGALSSLVGEPTILEQEYAAQGQADAHELEEALTEAGLDPDDFSTDQLVFFHEAENYDELYALLQEHADRMWSEDYAQGYFDVLGSEGIAALLATLDSYAHIGGGPVGDVGGDLLIPFANGFASTTGSPDLAQEREELLDVELGWEVRHLAMLLAGDGSRYDPTFLADAADVVLMGDVWYPANDDDSFSNGYGAQPNLYGDPDPSWYRGLNGGPLYDDLYLNYPELMALQALADNVEASLTFTMESPEHMEALVHPEPELVFISGGDRDLEEVLTLTETWAGDVLVNAFLEAPYGVRDPDAPGGYRQIVTDWDAQLDAYDAFMIEVGDGGVPDIIKRAAASTLLPYLPDMADVAAAESLTSAVEDEGRFRRPTLIDFFEELSYDEEAIEIFAGQVGLWGDAMLLSVPPGELQDDALTNALRRITLMTGAAVDGLTANERTRASDHAAFWSGLTKGTSFILSGGAALVPVIAGGPVFWGVTAGISGTAALINFGLGTYSAGQDPSVPDFDADDFENLLAVQWREMLATYHYEAGNLTTVDGDPLPPGASLETQVNALTRLMAGNGGDDKFEEVLQSIDDDRDPDDHW